MSDANYPLTGTNGPDGKEVSPVPSSVPDFLTQRALASSGDYSLQPVNDLNKSYEITSSTVEGRPAVTYSTPPHDFENIQNLIAPTTLEMWENLEPPYVTLEREFLELDKQANTLKENKNIDPESFRLLSNKTQKIKDLLKQEPTQEVVSETEAQLRELELLIITEKEKTHDKSIDNSQPHNDPQSPGVDSNNEDDSPGHRKGIDRNIKAVRLLKRDTKDIQPLSIPIPTQEPTPAQQPSLVIPIQNPQPSITTPGGVVITFGDAPENNDPAVTTESSPEKYSEGQVYEITPRNIYWQKSKTLHGGKGAGRWVIKGVGDRQFQPEPLTSADNKEWLLCREQLARYAKFIARVPKDNLAEYTPLIEAKLDVLDALEQANFTELHSFGENLYKLLSKAENGEALVEETDHISPDKENDELPLDQLPDNWATYFNTLKSRAEVLYTKIHDPAIIESLKKYTEEIDRNLIAFKKTPTQEFANNLDSLIDEYQRNIEDAELHVETLESNSITPSVPVLTSSPVINRPPVASSKKVLRDIPFTTTPGPMKVIKTWDARRELSATNAPAAAPRTSSFNATSAPVPPITPAPRPAGAPTTPATSGASSQSGAGSPPPVPPPPQGPPSGPPTPPPSDPPSPEPIPPSPDREPRRLDVAGGWPTNIYKKEIGGSKNTKGRIEWYRVFEAQEKPLIRGNEWNAFFEEFTLLFKDYSDLMLTGNTRTREAKKKALESLIIAKNNAVDAIANGDLDKAKSLAIIFTRELIDADELWKNKEPNLIEEAKSKEANNVDRDHYKKLFTETKDAYTQSLSDAQKIQSRLQIDSLERTFINDQITTIKSLYTTAEKSFDVSPFDKQAFLAYADGIAFLKEKVLTPIKEKVEKINPYNILSSSTNKKQTVLRTGGRPSVSAAEWDKEQKETAKEKAENDANERLNTVDVFIQQKEKEYNADPVAFVEKYLNNRWTAILSPHEKRVIDVLLERAKNNLLPGSDSETVFTRAFNQKEFNDRIERDRTRAGRTTQTYSPTAEENALQNNKVVKAKFGAEAKLVGKINSKGELSRGALDDKALAAHRKDERPLQNGLYVNGMTRAANVLASVPHAKENAQANTPENTQPITTPNKAPSQEERARAVSGVLDKVTSFAGDHWWRIFGSIGAAAAIAYAVTHDKNSNTDRVVQQPVATSPAQKGAQTTKETVAKTPQAIADAKPPQQKEGNETPLTWAHQMTNDQSLFLLDLEKRSIVEFLNIYVPYVVVSPTDTVAAQKILQLNLKDVWTGEEIPKLSETRTDEDVRRLICGMMREIMIIDRMTGKTGADNNMSYNDFVDTYGDITIEEYLKRFKNHLYLADEETNKIFGK